MAGPGPASLASGIGREAPLAEGAPRVVITALLGHAAIAAAKYVAAAVTGSVAMLAEAVHSTVDTGHQVLLLVGLQRAARAEHAAQRFGQGREVHFWAVVLAILLFGLGAGVSVHAGLDRLADPRPLQAVGWAYLVLAVAIAFDAGVLAVAWQAAASKGPARFVLLFAHGVALAGLGVALLGVFCSDRLGWLRADGAAALFIGVLLAAAALALAGETRRLLIGEAASPDLVEDLLGVAGAAAFVEGVNEVRTVHFGPGDVLVNLSVDARDHLTAGEVETGVSALEAEIRARHHEVSRVFIEIQAAAGGAASDGSRPR